MIFGFVLGGTLLRAGIALINFGFVPAVSESTIPSIFSILAILMMYMFLIMALVNKSFSLIYQLPNQIMKWMGGQAEGGEPSEMIQQAKGGFDSGAGKVQEMGGEIHKGATEKMGHAAMGEEGRESAGVQSKYRASKKPVDLP